MCIRTTYARRIYIEVRVRSFGNYIYAMCCLLYYLAGQLHGLDAAILAMHTQYIKFGSATSLPKMSNVVQNVYHPYYAKWAR